MNIEYENVYKELLDNISFEEQTGYFYEEIGELLQAINKYKRSNGSITKDNIFDELVDVQIQLDILKVGYEIPEDIFSSITMLKIAKIKKYINKTRIAKGI